MAAASTGAAAAKKLITFVTGNAKKLEELQAILQGSNIAIRSQKVDRTLVDPRRGNRGPRSHSTSHAPAGLAARAHSAGAARRARVDRA